MTFKILLYVTPLTSYDRLKTGTLKQSNSGKNVIEITQPKQMYNIHVYRYLITIGGIKSNASLSFPVYYNDNINR